MLISAKTVLELLLFCSAILVILAEENFDPDELQLRIQNDDINDENSAPRRSISIVGNDFMLDGQRLLIVSGSIHYYRLPAEYWRDRLTKLKAAGLNTVCTYVEWSYHEPKEREYSFEGDQDLVAFIETAAELGLYVLLRPGPYICSERDLGGLPYWLLGKYPNIRLRTTDSNFMKESKIWLNKLFEKVSPYLYGNGGPIILVQVENEYGSYGKDMAYKTQMRDILAELVGNHALLYTTDGTYRSYIDGGSIPDTLTTIDFGPVEQSVLSVFEPLRSYMPVGPLMNSEYYSGWLTHWRERMAHTDTANVVRTMEDMINNSINFNFYMFFGGSNFEYSAGANHDGTYKPDLTSYDYDAPLSEAGDPTPKYYAIRSSLKRLNFSSDLEEPVPQPKGNYGEVTVDSKYQLLSSKGRAALGKKYSDREGAMLPTFESLRQRGGLLCYETIISGSHGLLEIRQPRDLVFVYIDGEYKGIISRMYSMYSLPIEYNNGSVLSLLVESQGRINYGPHIHDYKGILSDVRIDKKSLNGKWTVLGFPLENLDTSSESETVEPTGAALYETQFTLPEGETPLDTFIDPTGWSKGYIWVNGHNLGRYWPTVGPQVTLYVPGVWLKASPAQNTLQVLELLKSSPNCTLKFIDHHILNSTGTKIYW